MSKNSIHQCKGGKDCHEENHLCRIAVKKDLERVRKVVKEAVYFCKKCGRSARLEEHLCKPSKI